MLDKEKLIEMSEDTIIHKKLVLDNCLLVGKYLIGRGDVDLGVKLMRRGCEHDNSKFNCEEFKRLASILKSRKCFKDANSKLSMHEVEAIECHWRNNRHHPEYYKNIEDMGELDILEMVCDWYARSKQYGTDFLEFVEVRQKNRFGFSKGMFERIKGYCELIVKLDSNDGNI